MIRSLYIAYDSLRQKKLVVKKVNAFLFYFKGHKNVKDNAILTEVSY